MHLRRRSCRRHTLLWMPLLLSASWAVSQHITDDKLTRTHQFGYHLSRRTSSQFWPFLSFFAVSVSVSASFATLLMVVNAFAVNYVMMMFLIASKEYCLMPFHWTLSHFWLSSIKLVSAHEQTRQTSLMTDRFRLRYTTQVVRQCQGWWSALSVNVKELQKRESP